MRSKKIIAVFLLVSLLFVSAVPVAASADDGGSSSGVNSFISTITSWGEMIVKLTGEYDVLDGISKFAAIVRTFDSFVSGNNDGVWGFIKSLLHMIGVEIDENNSDENEDAVPDLPAPSNNAPGTYSL
jgi:hypothetical protein